MYVYDQERTSGVSGIGWLDAFGKSQKKKAEESAEAKRLEDEIVKLDAKSTKAGWSGVDRTYEEWLKVRDENDNTKWTIHQKAAHAAKMLGKAGTRYKRLWTALALLKLAQGPSEERNKIREELKVLGDKWVHVGIQLTRKSSASLEYNASDRPVEEIEAIELAQKKLRTERMFNGLLPLGIYVISGQRVELFSSDSWSRVWAIHHYQKDDGTFRRLKYPRKPTSEVDPPLDKH
jgi:hypothetical protein